MSNFMGALFFFGYGCYSLVLMNAHQESFKKLEEAEEGYASFKTSIIQNSLIPKLQKNFDENNVKGAVGTIEELLKKRSTVVINTPKSGTGMI